MANLHISLTVGGDPRCVTFPDPCLDSIRTAVAQETAYELWSGAAVTGIDLAFDSLTGARYTCKFTAEHIGDLMMALRRHRDAQLPLDCYLHQKVTPEEMWLLAQALDALCDAREGRVPAEYLMRPAAMTTP